MKPVLLRTRRMAAVAILAIASASVTANVGRANAASTFLPASHIVLKSARDVDNAAGTAVIPLHRGTYEGKTVWYILTDSSDYGISHDLDILYAPKLSNIAIGCPNVFRP